MPRVPCLQCKYVVARGHATLCNSAMQRTSLFVKPGFWILGSRASPAPRNDGCLVQTKYILRSFPTTQLVPAKAGTQGLLARVLSQRLVPASAGTRVIHSSRRSLGGAKQHPGTIGEAARISLRSIQATRYEL